MEEKDEMNEGTLRMESSYVKDGITKTMNELSESLQIFSSIDYGIFFVMLLLCALIGVYFGVIDKRNNKSSVDYLMGGRSMDVFPISMSLIASYISGITLLGFPTEIYIYGIQYSYTCGGLMLMAVLMCYLYLPTLHDLKLTSSYEYLSLRFDNRVRLFGSMLFCISIMNWLPLVIYVPALAFNQVTGINVHVITPFVSLVCVFYTTLGGLKAVVWTDVLQTFSMFGAIILVCVKGTYDVGGIGELIRRNAATGRIEIPDTRLDPTVRHTIWGLVIGGSMYYLQSNAISQSMIQRYLALPTLKKAKTAVWGFTIGTLLLTAFCTYSGMLIFATYYNCDPLSTKLAKAKDQLLPLLVMETLGDYPGLPGLFVAGVFSAALSSMSTGLNSMSAVILEDFYKTYVNKEPTEKVTNIIMRSVVIVTGIICVVLVYVVEKLGQVLQLAMSLSAITNGPSMGVFTMGLFLPWINATGALWGGLIGLLSMVFLILGTQNAIAKGLLKFQPKPVSTEGCTYLFNHSTSSLDDGNSLINIPLIINNLVVENDKNSSNNGNIIRNPSPTSVPPVSTLIYGNNDDDVFVLFRLSYMWYTCVGMLISIFVALIVTYITKRLKNNENKLPNEKFTKNFSADDANDIKMAVYGVDLNLLSPVVRSFYRNKIKKNFSVKLKNVSTNKTAVVDNKSLNLKNFENGKNQADNL